MTRNGRQTSQSWVEADIAKYLAQSSRPGEQAVHLADEIIKSGYSVWGVRVWTRKGLLWVEDIPRVGPYAKPKAP